MEDYDNLPIMDSAFNDEGSSLRWFAPQGCSVEVDQHSIDDADFPGGYRLLAGFSLPFAYPNLGTIHWDNGTDSPNDQISAVRFSCDGYYERADRRLLGLNFDGSYETNGASASFSATSFDGPTVAYVPTRAQHATDTTALGTGTTPFPVTVRNVAPVIRTATVTDPLGRDLNGGTNLAIGGVRSGSGDVHGPGRADADRLRRVGRRHRRHDIQDVLRRAQRRHRRARRHLRLHRARHVPDRGDHHR